METRCVQRRITSDLIKDLSIFPDDVCLLRVIFDTSLLAGMRRVRIVRISSGRHSYLIGSGQAGLSRGRMVMAAEKRKPWQVERISGDDQTPDPPSSPGRSS